jgi:sterol-4alpha-carboxylate 3-dehydrogenase (decarboxylating)
MAQLAKSWEGRIAAVTGASGAFGTFLVRDLVKLGARVRALDLRFDDHAGVYKEAGDRVEFIQGDVTKPSEALTEALKGVDVLFHTVAYFGFPAFARPEYAQPGNAEIMRKINVTSTSHLLDVCVEQGVRAFVFTASVNTMFVGEPMLGTTEDESYPPAEKYIDSYGPTKSEAERLVLSANGRGSLRTASVRPNGIWGPTDRCIAVIKTITQYASMGGLYFKFKGWDGMEPVTDWTHVDNLSRAEILAAEKCFEKDPKVCGSAYFVTDGDVQPITTWSIPLCRAAHLHVYPCMPVPVWMLPAVGRLSEQVCCLLRKLTGSKMAPMLGEMEALKAATTHYVSTEKAKKELGFEPKPYAKLMEEMAPWMRAYAEKNFHIPGVPLSLWTAICCGMALTSYLSFANVGKHGGKPWLLTRALFSVLPGVAEMPLIQFQKKFLIAIWLPMVGVHAVDGILAAIIAKSRGHVMWKTYGLRCLILGFAQFQHLCSPTLSKIVGLYSVAGFALAAKLALRA